MSGTPRRVLLLQRRMPEYRVALFERLIERLREEGVDLVVAYGSPSATDSLRQDEAVLPSGTKLPCRYLPFVNLNVFFLSIPEELAAASDLIILPHKNRILPNFLMMRRKLNDGIMLALFGHGGNLRSAPGSIRERIKAWLLRQVQWYFAYTSLSVERVIAAGFPLQRIICLNNSVDTRELMLWRENARPDELNALKVTLGIEGNNVAVFVGSLSRERRLDFLFRAGVALKQRMKDFEMLVVGDGHLRGMAITFQKEHPWVHFAGAKQGREKVLHCLLGKILLNPGMVGLNILDAFALGLPLVTTDCGLHAPEIAYLEPGVNGFMTENTVDAFVSASLRLLQDEPLRQKVRESALRDAGKYTLEQMVENFTAGILRALGTRS